VNVKFPNNCNEIVFFNVALEVNSVFLAVWLGLKVYRTIHAPGQLKVTVLSAKTPYSLMRIVVLWEKYDWYLPPLSSLFLSCIIASIPYCCDVYGFSGLAWCYIRADLPTGKMFAWLLVTAYFWVILSCLAMVIVFLPKICSRDWHIGFPIVFVLVWIFPTAQRFFLAAHGFSPFWLNVTHTIFTNVRGIGNMIVTANLLRQASHTQYHPLLPPRVGTPEGGRSYGSFRKSFNNINA